MLPTLVSAPHSFALRAGLLIAFACGQATAQLYDSQALVTCVGCAVAGTDASVDSSGATGFAAFGNWRLADDFAVTEADGWEISSITVYTYVTGATSSNSPITAGTLRIWSGNPGAPGAQVVFGDTTTDRLLGVSFADIHRIPFGFPLGDPDRPVFAAELAADTYLPAGDYWIDFGLEGDPTLSGPWVPSNPGSQGTSVFATNNLFASLVPLPEELPFLITGEFSPLTTTFCQGLPNSTGAGAQVIPEGTRLVSRNDLVLRLRRLPANQFAYFLASQTQGLVMPGGTQGNLCLSGNIGRYLTQLISSGATGEGSLLLNLGQTPTPQGPVAIAVGQTWNFQAWYRDVNPTTTSNFSDAVEIEFR